MGYEEAVRLARAPTDWTEGGRVHNWRNHIGDRIRLIWETFTEDQKVGLILDADERASNESWD